VKPTHFFIPTYSHVIEENERQTKIKIEWLWVGPGL